jgi:hypothetical protein
MYGVRKDLAPPEEHPAPRGDPLGPEALQLPLLRAELH